jgi:O-antigen/teichoic acid export membrane protein
MTGFLSLVAYRAFSEAAGKGAFFLITVLAARTFTEAEFGIFSLGTTLGWLAAVIADAGIQMHVARAIARRPERGAELLAAWTRVRIVSSIGALALVLGAVPWLEVGASAAVALLALTAVYLMYGLVEFFYYVFRGVGRTDLESTFTLAQRGATLACAPAVLWFWPDVLPLALAMAVPALVTVVASAHRASTLVVAAAPSAAVPLSAREFASDVLPIGAGIVFSAVYFRVDVVLLQLWGHAEAVGLYNAAFRLVDALRLVPAAVLAVALPELCRTTSAAPLRRFATVLTLGGSLIALALVAGAERIVPALYGESFASAVPALRVLALAFPLMCLNYALTHQLIGWNHHRAYGVLCAMAAAFNVTVNARLIPAASLVGAAWATLWTELLLTVGCLLVLGMGRRAASSTGLVAGASNEVGAV